MTRKTNRRPRIVRSPTMMTNGVRARRLSTTGPSSRERSPSRGGDRLEFLRESPGSIVSLSRHLDDDIVGAFDAIRSAASSDPCAFTTPGFLVSRHLVPPRIHVH